MTVKTYSAFTYGHTITDSNKYLNFDEGGGELQATLRIGSYTLGQFTIEIARAMNEVASVNEYTTTIDRSTRQITIDGTGIFNLLVSTGTQAAVSVFGLAGFTGADLLGLDSYEGDSASGSIFEPQFLLQSYVPFDNEQSANNVTVNESAYGILEVIKYGDINFMSCNITLQKNMTSSERSKGSIIKYSETGYTDLLAFMRYAVTKAPIEFIEDIDTPGNFTNCILERTSAQSNGTGFRLVELYSKGFADWFETGNLKFRKEIV